MTDSSRVVDDLLAEGDDMHATLTPLAASDLARPTPAPGWTIADQVSHLAMTDTLAILSAASGAGARALLASMDRRQLGSFVDIAVPTALFGATRPFQPSHRRGTAALLDRAAHHGARRRGDTLVAHWQERRHSVVRALRAVPEETKLPWIGPPMRPATMAAARLMETYAHGQDILDSLGIERVATQRLWHVADLGVRTRRFAYNLQRLPVPPAPRVELTAPDGTIWTWGSSDSHDVVTGVASDFCLLVTHRKHRDDCDVTASGTGGQQWLTIAQAFAGPPGGGRAAQ